MSQNAPKISGLSGSFDVSRKTATVTTDYNVLVVDDVVIQTVAGKSLFLPLNPTQGLEYLLLASGVTTTVNGNGQVINGLATLVIPVDAGLIVAWDVDSGQWVGGLLANAAAGGATPYAFVFRPGAGAVAPPVYSDPAVLSAALRLVPGPKVLQIDTSAQAFAPAVLTAAGSPYPFDGITITFQNEDELDFADGAHIDPQAVYVKVTGGGSIFPKGTTPVWTPANPFSLVALDEGVSIEGDTAPFMHLTAAASPSAWACEDTCTVGDGVHATVSVDAGAILEAFVYDGSTIQPHATTGAGTLNVLQGPDGTVATPQDITTTTITLAADATRVAFTPGVPGNWSPVPTQVAQALDQLAAKVGSLFPTFGLTMYAACNYENTVVGANVTQVVDQSTALHLFTAAGTTGPTQTPGGIGTLTTWHFDQTANGGAGNKLVSEGPAGSNTPPTEFYLGDENWTIACIFKANGALLHNFANSATCPTLFGTSSGSNPPLGAGLVCGLNPGDPTQVQVSGYVTDGASVMHTAPAQAAVANGHYVIAEFVGGVISTYLDHLAATTVAGVGPIGDHTNQVQVGRNQASTLSNYSGEMALMLTWNRDLTSSERTQVQNGMRALSGLP